MSQRFGFTVTFQHNLGEESSPLPHSYLLSTVVRVEAKRKNRILALTTYILVDYGRWGGTLLGTTFVQMLTVGKMAVTYGGGYLAK